MTRNHVGSARADLESSVRKVVSSVVYQQCCGLHFSYDTTDSIQFGDLAVRMVMRIVFVSELFDITQILKYDMNCVLQINPVILALWCFNGNESVGTATLKFGVVVEPTAAGLSAAMAAQLVWTCVDIVSQRLMGFWDIDFDLCTFLCCVVGFIFCGSKCAAMASSMSALISMHWTPSTIKTGLEVLDGDENGRGF
ncbi:hypothetical protein VNO80_25657 [Phaseolus coccineus]|uniref:Uncharacterized protein n=1 Tax=Phaseolus coccineus TaxID=3886 RepID=A0AAN9LVP0_PHACN